MVEIWKTILGYDDYEVSNKGSVRSCDKELDVLNRGKFPSKRKFVGRVLSYNIRRGYLGVVLFSKDRKRSTFSVQRLVATHFIPNPENKPQVNHIDGNKRNNSIENLEWVTSSENIIHAWRTGLSRKATALLVFNKETGIFYESIVEAAKTIGLSDRTLGAKLLGKKRNKTSFIYA